jgi:Protein of unknown function (DUF2281)
MTLLEEITKQLSALPPEQQTQVLDFIASLQARVDVPPRVKPDSLKTHAAFGSWKDRKVDPIKYQQDLRDEWGTQ